MRHDFRAHDHTGGVADVELSPYRSPFNTLAAFYCTNVSFTARSYMSRAAQCAARSVAHMQMQMQMHTQMHMHTHMHMHMHMHMQSSTCTCQCADNV